MTQRENLLALVRRQPYEFVPVEFMLCPSLIEDYRREENQPEMPYEDYFQMPWRRVGDLVPDDTDLTRFETYHAGRLNDRVTIDEWGVGHESTPTSMHMTRMLFPLGDAEDVQDILDYPLPTYSLKNNGGLAGRVQALHKRGIASVGNMQCTIWETSWYIRGMENLMMDMVCDEEMAAAILDRVAAMSTQTVMPFGTPDQVRAEVWKNLDIASEGGLFVAPTHLLEPEVPWQNIRAYVQACRDYPLHR